MQDLFDEELKELLQGTKIQVPESYDKKVEEALSNISIPSKKRYLHLFYSKTAAVIVICVTVLASSLGVGAALNLYREKMQSMTEEEKKHYNKEVQDSEAAGDSYSRALTEKEETIPSCRL